MVIEIKLEYQPLSAGSGLSVNEFDRYMIQPSQIGVARAVAISPLEDSMKLREKNVFEFDDFKVSRKIMNKKTTSWEKVFNSLVKFLEIRADDSRAYDMDGLKLFDGLGYCISTNDLKDYIDKQENQYTSSSEYPQLFWPKAGKNEELPSKLVLPDRNYSKVNNENARIALDAKRFCSGLDKKVINAFKDANKSWFKGETGYSMDNLPEKDDGSVKRTREIGSGRYAFVNLIREETPQYKESLGFLLAELQDIENGISLEGYKSKQEKGHSYVNIKNVLDRLSNERLKQDCLVKIQGRYEIVP